MREISFLGIKCSSLSYAVQVKGFEIFKCGSTFYVKGLGLVTEVWLCVILHKVVWGYEIIGEFVTTLERNESNSSDFLGMDLKCPL